MTTPIDDGGPAFPIDSEIAHKFFERVDFQDHGDKKCWEWLGYKTAKGYGVFAPAKRIQYRAHRFSFEVFNGRKPKQMVLHKCDNPSCVNPHHLEDGDHGANMKQMAERKRAAREERHHKAVLTFAEAASIALLSISETYTTKELAAMFGVSHATAIAAARGANWPDAHQAASALLAERQKGTK